MLKKRGKKERKKTIQKQQQITTVDPFSKQQMVILYIF